jgi:hypothetical protein
MRLILCSLVVLAWTSGPFFGPKAPTLSEIPAPPPAIETVTPTVDFDNLHAQARDALAELRQSQAAHRVAVASAARL